ncbi:hypothetical protein JCM10908_003536 [Rhodotorula pacifica]|uniref:uncharacterized protein n=1 Tax=Rhodotorula pacifica TaxID=1495444 RepID=UPI003170E778
MAGAEIETADASDRLSSLSKVASLLSTDRPSDDEMEGSAPQWKRNALRSWLKEEVERRVDEYSEREEIRIWCGTYNVNDKCPKTAREIEDWVHSCGEAELLVFSFQEFDLSTEAMFRYTSAREDSWRKAIEQALSGSGSGHSYNKLHSRQLVGGLILIYVRSDVRDLVSAVSSASLATGLMGVMANKGAVAIRLRYLHTPLTFVNSHLAAFVPNSEERNAQYQSTTSQLLFPPAADSSDQRTEWSPCLRPDEPRPVGNGWTLWDCDGLIWMGDLNYRLDAAREDIDELIKRRDYDGLLAFDQLAVQQRLGLAFEGFKEGRITFPPTFKFDAGTDTYDSSEKQRDPAYTDRVIYLASSRCPISVERYDSHPSVLLSDHKPVTALLRLPVFRIDHEKREAIANQLLSSVRVRSSIDELEPADVELAPSPEVKFAQLELGQSLTATLKLCNRGDAATPWAFVPRPDSNDAMPSWLTAVPALGVLQPNTRQTICFTTRIEAPQAGSLSFPEHPGGDTGPALSELLILSVRGRDLFLSVSLDSWVPTVLGSRLDHLVHLTKPIRETTLVERCAIATSTASCFDREDGKPTTTETVPAAIRQLVGYIANSGLGLPDLFHADVKEERIREILHCLDSGAEFPKSPSTAPQPAIAANASTQASGDDAKSDKQHLVDAVDLLDRLEADLGSVSLHSDSRDHSEDEQTPSSRPAQDHNTASSGADTVVRQDPTYMHAAAKCLLRLLEALPEPLVESRLYEVAICCDSREAAYEVLHSLNEVHANTLLYLIAFLRILLRQSSTLADKAYLQLRLAIAFSKVLLRPPSASDSSTSAAKGAYAPQGMDPGSVPRRAKQFVAFLLQEEEVPS